MSLVLIAFFVIQVIIFAGVLRVIRKENHMGAELDRLTASVGTLKGKVDTLIALIPGLSNGPALTALADQVDAEAAVV